MTTVPTHWTSEEIRAQMEACDRAIARAKAAAGLPAGGAPPPTAAPDASADPAVLDAVVRALGLPPTADGQSIVNAVQRLVDSLRPSVVVAASYGLSEHDMQVIRSTPRCTPHGFLCARRAHKRGGAR